MKRSLSASSAAVSLTFGWPCEFDNVRAESPTMVRTTPPCCRSIPESESEAASSPLAVCIQRTAESFFGSTPSRMRTLPCASFTTNSFASTVLRADVWPMTMSKATPASAATAILLKRRFSFSSLSIRVCRIPALFEDGCSMIASYFLERFECNRRPQGDWSSWMPKRKPKRSLLLAWRVPRALQFADKNYAAVLACLQIARIRAILPKERLEGSFAKTAQDDDVFLLLSFF